jgi:hypothetical protein
MAITTGLEATLQQGEFTLLHRARLEACRVTVTGIAGEFDTIPFRVRRLRPRLPVQGPRRPEPGSFEATEVSLTRGQAFPRTDISASAPAGVGSLDIVYDVRTGSDA